MTESKLESFWVRCGLGTASGRRAELRLAGMCLVWALSLTGGTYLIKSDLLPAGPISWAVAALPSAVAVFVLVEYTRFLREADELHRLIQLQALAFGFGGGFFVIIGYLQFEKLGAPTVGCTDLLTVMPLLYAVGTLVGWRRYR